MCEINNLKWWQFTYRTLYTPASNTENDMALPSLLTDWGHTIERMYLDAKIVWKIMNYTYGKLFWNYVSFSLSPSLSLYLSLSLSLLPSVTIVHHSPLVM